MFACATFLKYALPLLTHMFSPPQSLSLSILLADGGPDRGYSGALILAQNDLFEIFF